MSDFQRGFAWGFLPCLWLMAFACISVASCTQDAMNGHWQAQAIDRAAAEYVITDPKTGAVEFRWKENK